MSGRMAKLESIAKIVNSKYSPNAVKLTAISTHGVRAAISRWQFFWKHTVWFRGQTRQMYLVTLRGKKGA